MTDQIPRLYATLVIITNMPFTEDQSLAYYLVTFAFLSRSDSRISRTSCLKARVAIQSFGLRPGVVSQAAIITLRAETSLSKKWELCELLLFELKYPYRTCSTSCELLFYELKFLEGSSGGSASYYFLNTTYCNNCIFYN